MKYIAEMDLQFFAEEAAAAPAEGMADAGTAADEGIESFNAGDTLADGTEIPSAQVAAALNKQMARHPELRKVYGQNRKAAQPAQPAEAQPEANEEQSLEERWNELRRGEFKDLYAQDVRNAIQDRFKNQEDANAKLAAMQPMLDALMKKADVESVEELQNIILDDDSLYEDEAEAMGMTVSAYKSFKKLQDEHDQMAAAQQQSLQQQMFREHIGKLIQQGEQLKQTYPGFDFDAEMQNETFRRLTSPEVGLSVEDAYYAVHHNELAPQMLAYGMQRAKEQMGQTIQAQKARPAEGALRNQGQPAADVRLNPKNMTRKERDMLRQQIHAGKMVTFD